MNKTNEDIKKIIKENNITTLTDLLKFLNCPDIEYQLYWLIKVIDTGELLYSDDCEYFFYSSYDNDYIDLDNFQTNYYDIELCDYDDYYYLDASENILYFYVFRNYEPNEIYEEDLEELSKDDEYSTYEDIVSRFKED